VTAQSLFREILSLLKSIREDQEASSIAHLLFEKFAGMDRPALIRQPDLNLSAETETSLRESLSRLLNHEPVQYILGEAPFLELMLEVGPTVLIPRPETEELATLVIQEKKVERPRILDIGTGSGCIAIALKKSIPLARITAIDISADALQIAKRNALKQQVDINFELIDILEEQQWEKLGSFDMIVSNPPYISMEEKNQLEKHVRDYEPATALFAHESDPLVFYRKIAAFCHGRLNSGGALYVEINNLFASETANVMMEAGFKAEIFKDIFGNQRFIKATRYR
jgi:release factor glutamine methyltransferase